MHHHPEASQAVTGGQKLLTPREIYEHLDRYVIGQHRAKQAVAIAAYNHQKRVRAKRSGQKSLLRKSNLLMIGPTGSGKTHIARNLAEALEVPFSVVDATEFTEAGYYGKDVETMISELLVRSQQDARLAEVGIVFVDEVDKIARRTQWASNGAGSRDIGGEGVQQALLKLLEGRKVLVPLNVTQHWSKHDFVQIDTSDILFICAGTFSDLLGSPTDRQVGFGSWPARRGKRTKRIGSKELMEYGMVAEFIGRLPVLVQLEELDAEQLLRVLVEPPDALLREYRELLAQEGIDLTVTDDAQRAIVDAAISRGLGARALRGVMEEVMTEVLFYAPERQGRPWTLDAAYVERRLAYLDERSSSETSSSF